MKKATLLSMAVSLGLASLSANAARPSRSYSHPDMAVSCTCDWSTNPGNCTVSWNAVHARSYKAGIGFKADWNDNGVAMSTTAKINLSGAWTCDRGTGTCSASGPFVVPDGYPSDATVAFDGKALGYSNDVDHVRPRYFARGKAACNMPQPPASGTAPPLVITPGGQY